MHKGLSLPKDFSRFYASNKFNLLALQAYTFGLHNSRLKLKGQGYKFRSTDLLPTLIVGQFSGCTLRDFGNVLGYQISVCRKVLTRTANRGLIYQVGGRRGRGHASKFYLNDTGHKVYETLQCELGKSLTEAKREFARNIVKHLHSE